MQAASLALATRRVAGIAPCAVAALQAASLAAVAGQLVVGFGHWVAAVAG